MNDQLPRKRIIGYADELSVSPGQTIEFKVSCEGLESYQADIVKLRCGDLHPQGRGVIESPFPHSETRDYEAREQPINAGSYGVIDSSTRLANLSSFSLQCWIWPTTPGKGEQLLMGCWNLPRRSGYALGLDEVGAVVLKLGNGACERVTTGVALPIREWALVGASYDATSGDVRVWQTVYPIYVAEKRFVDTRQKVSIPPAVRGEPFLIGAAFVSGDERGLVTGEHYNGKIEAPQVFGQVVDFGATSQSKSFAHTDESLLAQWDFALETPTDRFRDVGGNDLHGRFVNLPARAMTGHNWNGTVHDWKQTPEQYGAVHFHDDDIYDCGWRTDFCFDVPDDITSGIFAARIKSGDDEERIPFVVRPKPGTRGADVVVLLPTASYLAYANEHCGGSGGGHIQVSMNHTTALAAQDLLLDERPELGLSMYDRHSDGSGVCYSSRLRPVLNMRPGVTNSWVGAAGTIPWQFNADLPLVDWLEHENIDYDVVTDEDLHREGFQLLEPYRVVLTASHPEYYSTSMHDAMGNYLRGGGRLMYLGGNGFYWRVAFHDELPGVMELRRAEDGIRDWVASPGEYHMSFTGEYGGMWQRNGRPIYSLVGVGMAGQGFDICGWYRRTAASREPRASFMFEGIADEIIGDFGTVGGGAAGIEVDRFSTELGSPPHALVVATSEGLSDTYYPGPEDIDGAHSAMDATLNSNVRADMTFFETPCGGAVFSVGSIAYIGSLSWNEFDNNVARLTGNVLRRFLDDELFDFPV